LTNKGGRTGKNGDQGGGDADSVGKRVKGNREQIAGWNAGIRGQRQRRNQSNHPKTVRCEGGDLPERWKKGKQ